MFFIEDNKNTFISNDDKRFTELCPKVKMIDSSMFCIKYSFFKECFKKGDISKYLWRGKFKVIENKAMFVPINSKENIIQLSKAEEIFSYVNANKLKY